MASRIYIYIFKLGSLRFGLFKKYLNFLKCYSNDIFFVVLIKS